MESHFKKLVGAPAEATEGTVFNAQPDEVLDKKGIVRFSDFDHNNFAVFGRKTAELATQFRIGQTTDGFGSTEQLFRMVESSNIDGKTFAEHRRELFAEYEQYFGVLDKATGRWMGKDQDMIYELQDKLQALVMRIADEDLYPGAVGNKIREMHRDFVKEYGPGVSFFVRSSGKFEDMDAVDTDSVEDDQGVNSAAGQNTTVPNVIGEDNVVHAYFECLASLYNARSMSDRYESGFEEDEAAMMVTFHRTLNSATAGIGFTIESLTGHPEIMKVTLGKGTGEPLVSGTYGTCIYYVDKRLLNSRFDNPDSDINPILKKIFVPQDKMEVAAEDGGLHEVDVPEELQWEFPVTDQTVTELAEKMYKEEIAKIIDGKLTSPYVAGRDIEYGAETTDNLPLSAENTPNNIMFLQSRAETNFSHRFKNGYYSVRYKKSDEAKNIRPEAQTGIKASLGVGEGSIKIVRTGEDMRTDMSRLIQMSQEGNVIYFGKEANPDVNDALTVSSGMIIAHANTECHGAILAKAKGKAAGVQMFRDYQVKVNTDGTLQAVVTDDQGKTHVFNDGDYVTFAVTGEDSKPTIYDGHVLHKEFRLLNKEIPYTQREIRSIVADSAVSLSTSQISDRLTYGIWQLYYNLYCQSLYNALETNVAKRLEKFDADMEPFNDERSNLGDKHPVNELVAEMKELLSVEKPTTRQLLALREKAWDLTKTKVALFRTEFIYAQQLEAHPLIFHEYDLHKAFVDDMLQRYGSEDKIEEEAALDPEYFLEHVDKDAYEEYTQLSHLFSETEKEVGIHTIAEEKLKPMLEFIKQNAKSVIKTMDFKNDKNEMSKNIELVLKEIGTDDEIESDIAVYRLHNLANISMKHFQDMNTFLNAIIRLKKQELAEQTHSDLKQFKYERKLVDYVREKSAGYASPTEFAKEVIKQELKMMYSMYGHVEIRFYDNKPAEIKEYKGADSQLGGMPAITKVAQNEEFDPVRGSGLFLTPAFQDAWKDIELAAIREVQQEISELYGEGEGDKIQPFIVFSRTPEEYIKVMKMVEESGITGTGIMIETAENFINLMGYALYPPAFGSIGGNDGEATIHAIARVDRTRDIPGLDKNVSEALIGSIIKTAYFYEGLNIPLYSCGQNNSNNPLIAQMSAILPFSAVGVTEDVLPEVKTYVAAMEERLRTEFDGDKDKALDAVLREMFAGIVAEKAADTGLPEDAVMDFTIGQLMQFKQEGIDQANKVLEMRKKFDLPAVRDFKQSFATEDDQIGRAHV